MNKSGCVIWFGEFWSPQLRSFYLCMQAQILLRSVSTVESTCFWVGHCVFSYKAIIIFMFSLSLGIVLDLNADDPFQCEKL